MKKLWPLAIVVSAACAAGALPPSRSEIGSTLHLNDGEFRSGTRYSAGAHWASATVDASEDYDVGIGYIYERVDPPVGDITTKRLEHSPRSSQGGYISAAKVLSRNSRKRHRTWIGTRVEYLHAPELAGGAGVGILARVDWEVHSAVSGAGSFSDDCGGGIGLAYGVTGLGLYLESGVRAQVSGDSSFTTTAGVSLRLPFLGGVAYNLCGD